MSVQFRTSQKDIITKSNSAISKEIGVCCQYNYNYGVTSKFSTPLDCYLAGGNFQYGDLASVNCLDISASSGSFGSSVLGCCCACSIAREDDDYESYVSQMTPIDAYCSSTTVPTIAKQPFGLKKLTQCECERIGGKWTAGECPTELPDDASVRTYCYKRMAIEPAPEPPSGSGSEGLPCASAAGVSGGAGIRYFTYDFSSYDAGVIDVNYKMYTIPDSMDIFYPAPIDGATYSDATIVASTNGFISGSGTLSFNYNPLIPPQAPPAGYTATYEKFVIKMNGSPTTRWDYTVSCPSNAPASLTSLAGISCDVDVRLPRSCCFFEYDINGFPVGISCENVCNPRECELKSISTHPSSYSLGTVCAPNILSTAITPSPYDCGNLASIMASGSNLFQSLVYGSCYTLIDNGIDGYSYDCDVTAEFFCYDGYWVPIENDNELCSNNPYRPQEPVKSARKVEPETMTQSSFDALNIRIGQLYKGGYYIGTFEPGSPINAQGSEIYGTKQFGYSSFINSDASGHGDNYSKWALFVEPLHYNISLFESSEPDNTDYQLLSKYDGFYNSYGNKSSFSGIKSKTTNTVVGKNRKGFVDFYIPSINELMFLTKQAMTNRYLAGLLNLSGTYMTSSSYENFIFTQYLSENPLFTDDYTIGNYGRILLAKPTSFLSCRFFRKIILT